MQGPRAIILGVVIHTLGGDPQVLEKGVAEGPEDPCLFFIDSQLRLRAKNHASLLGFPISLGAPTPLTLIGKGRVYGDILPNSLSKFV